MRFKRLDITRYGAFTDRTLNFGDGSADLHLIVGPNEAGKSTMLSAIGDLLWGMGERPPYAFRFDYRELRLGGAIEHATETLDFMRRKNRVNSLLSRAEQPLPDSSLAPFLGGLDRDGFDRMFGLNHERLRTGGQNMLSGREDVARVLFEAGTGLSGISKVLADLEETASTIFTGGARTKPLNVALKEREVSLIAVRTATIPPTKWKAIAKRLDDAEANHLEARERARALEERRSILERDQRARPILTKIDTRLAAIDALGALPALPADAATIRADGTRKIAETDFAIAEKTKWMDADDEAIARLPDRSVLLNHDTEINRLADALALHRRNVEELPSAKKQVEEADAARRRVLAEAGIADTTTVPSATTRLSVRKALDALSEAEDAVAIAEKDTVTARRKVGDAEKELSSTSSPNNLAQLRAALDGAPRDSARVRVDSATQIDTARRRTARALAQLAPWTGTPDDLDDAAVPSASVLDHHRATFDDILAALTSLQEEEADGQKVLANARAELVRLANLDREPPTPEKVAEARLQRDKTIISLAEADEGRWAMLVDVQRLVHSADTLADRREAEAGRVAEHAMAHAEIERAKLLLAILPSRIEAVEIARALADQNWETVWRAAGFKAAVTPQQLAGWVDARIQAIDATEFQLGRERTAAGYEEEISRHRSAIVAALVLNGTEADDGWDLDRVISEAASAAEILEQDRDAHLLATNRLAEAKRTLADAAEELATKTVTRDRLMSALPSAIASLGFGEMDQNAADLAVSAFDLIADQAEAARQADKKLEEIHRLTMAFDNDLKSLRLAISMEGTEDAAAFLARLRTELSTAKQTEADRIRLSASRTTQSNEIAELEIERAVAEQQLGELMAAAGVEDLGGVDLVIDQRAIAERLRKEIADLRDDLVDCAGGLAEDALRQEIAEASADEAAVELGTVKQAHQAIIDEISDLAAELTAAQAAEKEASTGADAADAVQAAETARATIVDLSGQYIRAKSAATMLRWAINRHRETRQAPLLARAGMIMANVTDGRFKGLALDWSHGDEPVIVAERADGERCGVDGMSEGSRDQLFLALRLAAIEERAADHSMPLICDDLFITADDARSAMLFRQMKDLSASTQVIVFTHHGHLEQIATETIGAGNYQVHHIQPV